MRKLIVTLCVIMALLPLTMLPLPVQASSSIDAGVPAKILNEQRLINITGVGKKIINSSALSALKRSLATEGWKPSGSPFYSGGHWLLRFIRTVVSYEGAFTFVLMPQMYWDNYGNCARYRANSQPVAGMRCRVVG